MGIPRRAVYSGGAFIPLLEQSPQLFFYAPCRGIKEVVVEKEEKEKEDEEEEKEDD